MAERHSKEYLEAVGLWFEGLDRLLKRARSPENAKSTVVKSTAHILFLFICERDKVMKVKLY